VWCNRPGGILLFVIPLSIPLIVLRIFFKTRFSWDDLVYYAIFFLIGYMMAADKRFTESTKKHGWICLMLWLVGLSGLGIVTRVFGFAPFSDRESFSLLYVIYQILKSTMNWGAVVFMLSVGSKYLNRNHKVLSYGNEAVLPFYLLHQTIILCVGWYVIRWEIGILLKLLIIIAVSFPMIMILYELLVRRFSIVRFLFGMRLNRATPVAAPELGAGYHRDSGDPKA